MLTGNVGADFFDKSPSMGFARKDDDGNEKIKDKVMDEAKKLLRPEFVNRVNEVIVFHKFKEEDYKKIITLELKGLKSKLAQKGVKLKMTPSIMKYLSQSAQKENLGARPIKRAIQVNIENKLSELLVSKELDMDQAITFSYKNGEVKYSIKEEQVLRDL